MFVQPTSLRMEKHQIIFGHSLIMPKISVPLPPEKKKKKGARGWAIQSPSATAMHSWDPGIESIHIVHFSTAIGASFVGQWFIHFVPQYLPPYVPTAMKPEPSQNAKCTTIDRVLSITQIPESSPANSIVFPCWYVLRNTHRNNVVTTHPQTNSKKVMLLACSVLWQIISPDLPTILRFHCLFLHVFPPACIFSEL